MSITHRHVIAEGTNMDRREVLRLLTGVLALPALHGLTAEEAFAMGRELHRAIAREPGPGRVLTDEQLRTVAAIVERIIPRTDTPGAADARVPEFIDLMLADWYGDVERTRFLDGLVQIDGRSRSRHGGPFLQLTEPQQSALLLEADAEVQALRAAGAPTGGHFFQQLKWLTVHGYYTSEPGVRQELLWTVSTSYDPCRAYVPRTIGGL